MNRNPYSPPGASVADPAAPPIVRPAEVTRAVQLLWASLALTFGATFLTGEMPEDPLEWGIVIAFALVFLAVRAWLVVMISQARNWARITYLLLTVATLLVVPFVWNEYVAMVTEDPIALGVELLAGLAEIVALVLLFRRTAGVWFRARSERDF